MTEHARQCAAQLASVVKALSPQNGQMTGMILGSGLASLSEQLSDRVVIPYSELPGFPDLSVSGHQPTLTLGRMGDEVVACLAGRVHYYEGNTMPALKTMLRTLRLIGCDQLVVTNSAGSINADVPAGSLMVIEDHINFSFNNPLVGANDDEFGTRFVPMDNAYDADLRQMMCDTAASLDIALHKGVYFGVLGPSFETPAEIRAFRMMGADCVGMSTVAGTIIARHCGLKVVALSAMVNMAADLHKTSITHAETLAFGAKAAADMLPLLSAFVPKTRQLVSP